jgi:hypothetical protein
VADKVATAFGNTFWWAVATILLAFIPTLFLPSHAAKARPDAGPDAPVDAGEDRALAEGSAVGVSEV